MLFAQYKAARNLELYLGDPTDALNAFSFARAVEYDECEAYPETFCGILSQWQLQNYYVPEKLGGKRHSFEELVFLIRVVARRDFTAAWVHGVNSLLGTMTVWIAGAQQQQRDVAKLLLSSKQVAVAYHEKAHGNDLIANEVNATQVGENYRIEGSKWVIGNATRGAALTVFARTRCAGGPRGFSLFFVDKRKLNSESFYYHPAVKTHGIRGADVSGIHLDNCEVPGNTLVGKPGSGLETTLKAFQVTRVIMPALSIGAADTALRSTLAFAVSRRLYGKNIIKIPTVQLQLADTFIDLLICECVSICAARSLHILPGQASIFSSIAKFLIPLTVERIFQRLSTVLGARHFVRDEPLFNIFQKMMRDQGCVSIGHVGSHINLNAITQQLVQLVKHDPSNKDTLKAQSLMLNVVFDLTNVLPEFEAQQLSLSCRGKDDVVSGISYVQGEVKKWYKRSSGKPVLAAELLNSIDRILELLQNIRNRVLAMSHSISTPEASMEMMQLARQYCLVYAAASCLQMWWHNRHALSGYFSQGEWLVLALERLYRELKPGTYNCSFGYVSNVFDALLELHVEAKYFSIIPVSMGQGLGAHGNYGTVRKTTWSEETC